ncbi:type III secretion inner rod protein HrpB2 [Paraburkholderia megapolitana]|uniref:Type III secretion inner rod protein HrpB2 n=2 Tax=Burkholderiaceae TaxID=119060 RepID=A0A1I3DU12_9BURK|nr:type III secretion inner rod protein HrpB2 [Paraburkholderia megapolitana]
MDMAMIAQFQQQIASTSSSTGVDASVSPQQADRFQALMNEGVPTPPVQSVPEHPDHNIVAKAVAEQATYYQQAPNDVMYLTQHMSSLSMERMAAANMTVQLEIASLNADLQVKMAAVSSSKDAVQTLMKNQ